MESLLYIVPYILVFIVDRVQAFRGVSNPKTWRLYVGIAITGIVAWVVSSHVHGAWSEAVYCALWGIGYPVSYVWNNSADTTF